MDSSTSAAAAAAPASSTQQRRHDGVSPASRGNLVPPRVPVPQRVPLRQTNSSIRIRRLTSTSGRPGDAGSDHDSIEGGRSSTDDPVITAGRRRSSSAPQRMPHLSVPGMHDVSRTTTNEHHFAEMPAIAESTPAGSIPTTPGFDSNQLQVPRTAPANTRPRGLSDLHAAGSGIQAAFGAGNAARANRGLTRMRSATVRSRIAPYAPDEYDADVLGLLDLVDPEVQTLSTLTNVQNSLFVPDLGRLVNRRPTYDLTSRPSTARMTGTLEGISRSRANTVRSSRAGTVSAGLPETVIEDTDKEPNGLERRASITSQLTERHWAVLPHGETLDGWTDAEIDELNDYVRHLLHSRREGFKRSWRGFKKYVSKPLGLFVFLYAVLVTLFGATWVIFLIGWISVGAQQSYAIDVIDNILVALFALMGDGLAPFRAVDTYHMCFIAHYHHLTWRLRKENELPKLQDHNDLPQRRRASLIAADLEAGESLDDGVDKLEFSVLNPRQQRRLQYHQAKFSKSHTFYKPHETATHHAFPLRLLVAVVVLLDCHSLFQVALGTCTWAIDYRTRSQAITATILSCSITCNIAAGVLVSIGDKRTRKKEVLDRIFRQALTQEAMSKIRKDQADHDRVNYEAIEEDLIEHDVADVVGATAGSPPPKDKHKRSREIPRITKTIPRVSKEMPRLSKDLSSVGRRPDSPTAEPHL